MTTRSTIFHVSRFTIHVSPFLVAALLIGLLAAWPAVSQPGLLNTRGGGDSPFLLQRLHQLTTALADGHFPVRWMPDANYGYGYPFFNFYAPLSIYIAALFRFLGFSFVRAIHLAQLGGFLVAAGAMFCLGRRWLQNDWAALLASAAYSLAPFHLVNVYVRGDSLAEFWAMAFYPLILLAADELITLQTAAATRPGRAIAWLALSYAALILSHNISALIFSPFLLLYVILRWWHGRSTAPLRPLAAVGVALILGLGLSAWFFLPALLEQGEAQLAPVTGGYFHYSNHFRGLDLIQPSLFFDYDVAGGRAFRMGLLQAFAATAGLIALLWRGRTAARAAQIFIPTALIIATLMISPFSRPLWDHLPLLPFTQFPWRFLSVQALAAALATGALALLPGRRLIVPAGILLLLLAALGRLQPDFLRLSDGDVTAARLAQYEWFTGNIGTTVSAEYLPPAVQQRPFTSPWLETGERDQARPLDGQLLDARLVERRATQQVWQLAAGESGATVILPTLAWPGWAASAGAVPIPLSAAPGSGLVSLALPAGEQTVVLKLTRTPLRLAAELLSLVAIILVALLLRAGQWPQPGRRTLALLALLAITAVTLHLWPARPLTADDLTWDFAQMGYLHRADAVPFTDGARLLQYAYSDEVVGPGERLEIRLEWGIESMGEATLELVTPAANRFTWTPIFARQQRPVQDGQVVYRFDLPENVPGGLVVPRLSRPQVVALTPSGQPRGDLFLRPIRITGAGEAAVEEEIRELSVRPVQVEARPDGTVAVQVQWLTQRPLSHNYNVSLRLANATGGLESCPGTASGLCQLDVQPGYGFQPSSGWPAGVWVHDWLLLPLPESLSGEAPYALTVTLYEPETGTAVLRRRLGEMVTGGERLLFRPSQPVFTLPETLVQAAAVFSDHSGGSGLAEVVALHGISAPEIDNDANSLSLSLYWEALGASREDYTHFIHLVDPVTGETVAQHDAMPRNNSYPTSQWTAGEIVSDPVTLDLIDVAPGTYQLVAGLYRNLGSEWPRLDVACLETAVCMGDGRVLLELISVKRGP